MIEVGTLKTTEYKGVPILIRRVGNVFEYIIYYKKNFYGGYNVITPALFRRILGLDYTKKQLSAAMGITLTMATTTAEYLLQN